MLRIDPSDAVPIWRQIEEGVRNLVARGALAPGDGVPSVRDLAKDLGINPGTVAKAYQRLGDEGILVVRRGQGTFVAEEPPRLSAERRDEKLRQAARSYAGVAITLGVDREDAASRVEEAYREMEREEP
ncbi:MAG: GntR family transcriptional regulator [Thermoanaerobaculia bacterium]|nr:GntR family transcriptional regulator [Thermoanaerobaculia bacterium]